MAMKYLASPYYSFDPGLMQYRYEQARKTTAHLIKQGEIIFSPIVHCHDLANNYNMPTDAGFWLKYDLAILQHCMLMYVLTLDGWEESIGVAAEINFCRRQDIPVEFIDPWQE